MVKIIKPNEGKITFIRAMRPATNEERYEGMMRSSPVASKSYIKEIIICETLMK